MLENKLSQAPKGSHEESLRHAFTPRNERYALYCLTVLPATSPCDASGFSDAEDERDSEGVSGRWYGSETSREPGKV